MSNQGCKDGYKTKILAYLKENTNSKNKASILKIRDAIYQGENGYDPLEKEREKIFDKNEENPASKEYDGKKKNYDTSSFRTIKNNVRALYEDGLIEVEDSEEPGYVRENKKECIYYKQAISAERFPLFVEQIIGMSNIRQDEKDEIINEILDSVGKANVKKYWMYIERTSPEYAVLKKSMQGEQKKKHTKVFGNDRAIPANSCDWVSLADNLQKLFDAMNEMSGEFCHKISFQLINYNAEGKREPISNGYEYVISPYFFNYSNGKIWLVGNKEKYDNLSNYPIELMENIQILAEKPRKMEDLPQGYLWNDRTKMEYPQQHQGGTYGDAIPIVIRVKKTDPRAYTRIYNTFNDEFYHLSGETEEYDRILVYKTSYFIVGWAIENYELVEIETPSVRKEIEGRIKNLKEIYESDGRILSDD